MKLVLIVIGGLYGLSMVALLGGAVACALSRRFREEMTGKAHRH